MSAVPPTMPPHAAAPELSFAVEGGEALARAAAPTVVLRLAVERVAGRPVRSATVGVRVDVAPARRSYADGERARLRDLFGADDQWAGALAGTLPWTRGVVLVKPFEQRTTVEVHLPCTYDFDVAAAKYLAAVEDGDVPLDLMFSGTLLYDDDGRVQAAPIPWDLQASYRLPVAVWRAAMRNVFGEQPWLRVGRDTFDRLNAFRVARGLGSMEAAVEALLGEEGTWTA